MPSLIDQLHDIEGLDPVSAWPLAIGWWLCIVFGLILLAIAIWLVKQRLDYLKSWKRDTFKKLDKLEKTLSSTTSKEAISCLSEYLRRIAMHRFPRKECAGLVGEAWLKWLKTHDPKQFDWTEKGKILIEMPYSRSCVEIPLQQVKELIQVVRYWVY